MNRQQLLDQGWGVVWGMDSFAAARELHAALGLSLHDYWDALDKVAFFGPGARIFWVKREDRP